MAIASKKRHVFHEALLRWSAFRAHPNLGLFLTVATRYHSVMPLPNLTVRSTWTLRFPVVSGTPYGRQLTN